MSYLVRPSILHSMKPFFINTCIQVPGIWWPVAGHIRPVFALGPYYKHAQEQQDKGCFMQCSHCHHLWNRTLFLLLGAYHCFESLIKRQWHKIWMQLGSGTYSISQVGVLFLSLFLILMLVAGLSEDSRHVVAEIMGEDEPIFQTSTDDNSQLEHMDW
jgi:hypothetical protein